MDTRYEVTYFMDAGCNVTYFRLFVCLSSPPCSKVVGATSSEFFLVFVAVIVTPQSTMGYTSVASVFQ